MTFDRVLPELLRIVSAKAPPAKRICVVRDVRGRVRLVVDDASGFDWGPIEAELSAALGGYFAGPILSTGGAETAKRLAKALLDSATDKWPVGWPRTVKNLLGSEQTVDVGKLWTGIERTIGKEAWLTASPATPPWPLVYGTTPPIATFHSFKGGVGRTTLVAAYALHVARSGRKVAVIDLDLEAPGIGPLFGVSTTRGVLDVLVDHIATGKLDLDGASAPAQVAPDLDNLITVFHAGTVDDRYVQKLARLGYSSAEPDSGNPVGSALTALLKGLKSTYDVILLDSRAGLHDLAGMALHGLAHVDVLVFRGTTQNLAGLEQTLRSLSGRSTQLELLLVETLLPSDPAVFEDRRNRTREAVYELMRRHIYEEDDVPQLPDIGEPHDVLSVRRKEALDALNTLSGQVEALLADSDLQAVAARLDEKLGFTSEVVE